MAPHCKTCRCGLRLKRHICTNCKTRKLEKFMVPTRRVGPFGKVKWRCADEGICAANPNYGISQKVSAAAASKSARSAGRGPLE